MKARAQVYGRRIPLPVSMSNGKCLRSRAVLFAAIGWGPHPCHWCRTALDWRPKGAPGTLEADHLNGDFSDDDLANLVPSCRHCNQWRARGTIAWMLRKWPHANWPEIRKWGPHKTVFGCGHPFVVGNIYRAERARENLCLTCHRSKARAAYHRNKQTN